MGLWQIIDTHGGELPEQWDDGLTFQPWEEGFRVDLVRDFAGVDNFNFIGTPNWVQPETAAEVEEPEPL